MGMYNRTPDEIVADYRTKYPDLTTDEEAAIRRHVEFGDTLWFRVTATSSDAEPAQYATTLDEVLALRSEVAKMRAALTQIAGMQTEDMYHSTGRPHAAVIASEALTQ